MKSEFGKTSLFVIAALALAVVAAWVEPPEANPGILIDEGEPLFPEFRDVAAVQAIEVFAYNEEEAVVRPLKLEFRDGRWVLSSHNNYPAEAGDRLAKTAAALLGLHKDMVVSDRIEDHATYGVIDPLDNAVASLAGRGKRVTLRDGRGDVLADLVLGNPVEAREGYRYVRPPGAKRVYGVKTDADPSANFGDWVEDNLLRLSSSQLRRITVNSYSIDETLGRLANLRRIVATRSGDKWTSEDTGQASQSEIQAAASALVSIRIVGARPKPRPLAEQLRAGNLELTLESVMSLRERGYFLAPTGQLLSNEGEIQADTSQGVVYTLRFGEIVSGSADNAAEDGQDRYLFVTVRHDPELAQKYGGAGDGAAVARSLGRKFSDWYYVISAADFARLRMKR